MMRAFQRILFGTTSLAAFWALVACGDPCKDLSEQVCGCMPTVAQQQACTTHVDALASQYHADPNGAVEQAGLNQCSALLNTCSCEALAAGNLAACGLAKE